MMIKNKCRSMVDNSVFAELDITNVDHYLNIVIRMSKAPWSLNGRATALRAVVFADPLGSIPSQGADNS